MEIIIDENIDINKALRKFYNIYHTFPFREKIESDSIITIDKKYKIHNLYDELKVQATYAIRDYFISYLNHYLEKEQILKADIDKANKGYERAQRLKQKNEKEWWHKVKDAKSNYSFFKGYKLIYKEAIEDLKENKNIKIYTYVEKHDISAYCLGCIDVYLHDKSIMRLSKKGIAFHSKLNLVEPDKPEYVLASSLNDINITRRKSNAWKQDIIKYERR